MVRSARRLAIPTELPAHAAAALAQLDGRAALDTLWAVLPQARLIGGAVRDLLAGRDTADLDLAAPEPPDRVMALLAAAGIRTVPTGLAHGTVTAIVGGMAAEITTLRRDVETDGRHAVVAWTDDWRLDAARRDFTINAMSLSRDLLLHDHHGGAGDLAAGRVRFVGDAEARIAEDGLRILRYFRFQARYGRGEPDPAAMQAIAAGAMRLDGLSAERVWSELRRLLQGPDPSAAFDAMRRLGVLDRLLPGGTDPDRLRRLLGLGAPADGLLRLAALAPAPPGELAQRLRLSNDEASRLAALRDGPAPSPQLDDDGLRRLLADEAAEPLLARSWLAEAAAPGPEPARWDMLRRRIEAMPRPVFPLAGRDAVAAGLAPGPSVGLALRRARAWWWDGGCIAGREACLARLIESAP